MGDQHYHGQRLSFGGENCTVRFIGQVKNTKRDWLGVEWDDPSKGKHNGSHENVKYFHCLSESPTAGSFIRPSRPSDPPLSFLEALRKKYASDSTNKIAKSEEEIHISGKTVEEIGFERIRQQLAALHELQIVILDGLCIAGIERRPWEEDRDSGENSLDGDTRVFPPFSKAEEIKSRGLNIVELDLSQNLIEQWADVVGICSGLPLLRTLKLNGNRFRDTVCPSFDEKSHPFSRLRDLSLDNTLLSWERIVALASNFPFITTFSAASNGIIALDAPLQTTQLKTLNLSSNAFTSLRELTHLTTLPHLTTLSLRSNPLTTLSSPPDAPIKFPALRTLDLTSTLLPSLPSLNPVPETFPTLTSLLTKNTPLTTHPSATLLTIARLATLTELNFSPITPAERENAELYYLSTITKDLATASDEKTVIESHPRWAPLCAKYDRPAILKKKETEEPGAGTLAARLTKFNFYMAKQEGGPKQQAAMTPPQQPPTILHSKLIPRTVDVYRLKGIVGRLFGIRPMSCKLIWETGEWDPVGEEAGWSVSEDESDCEVDERVEGGSDGENNDVLRKGKRDGLWRGGGEERQKGKWVRREMELVDGTREVGFWIEGKEARVRVELR